MNITLLQYNTVIDGLRTQLELYREHEKELVAINNSLLEQERKSHDELETCRLTAIGVFSDASIGSNPATAAVLSLRKNYDTAIASLGAMRANVAAVEAQIAALKRKGKKLVRRTALGDKQRA